MIHIVTASNRRFYAAQLDQMHETRRRLGNSAIGKARGDGPDGRDSFDDDHAVYVMALGPRGLLKCSGRIRPVIGRSIVEQLHARFVHPAESPLAALDTWDTGRLAVDPRDLSGIARTPELLLAAMEHASREGARRLIGINTVSNYERMLAANMNIRPLGAPLEIAGHPSVALEISTLPEDIAIYRRTIGRMGWAGYEIDEDDLEHCGDLEAIEHAFDKASAAPILQPEARAEAIAEVERAYRRWG